MCIRRCIIQLVTLSVLLLMMYCLNSLYVQYCCVLVCFNVVTYLLYNIGYWFNMGVYIKTVV